MKLVDNPHKVAANAPYYTSYYPPNTYIRYPTPFSHSAAYSASLLKFYASFEYFHRSAIALLGTQQPNV